MHSSVMITPDLLEQVGLPLVLEASHCRTPQGSRLKKSVRFYDQNSKEELIQELTAIDQLAELVRQKHSQLIEASTQLLRLRELRGTFERLGKGGLLDDTEFFELKSALTIFNRLSKLTAIQEAASVTFEDTSEAAALLNPGGKNSPAFHVYNEYSPVLAEIRARKKELERQISQSKESKRRSLLGKRALVIAEEDQEEERIRRELGSKLAQWLPQMQHNTAACGLLDFRLAKADLAVLWDGCMPQLADSDSPAKLTNLRHPLIAAYLERHGLEFTPISIELQKGTTILSGANMGGKSVALKTIFLALLITQLGYFPACESLQTPLYDFLAFESGQEGDIYRGLSSFGLEAVKIRDHHRRSKTQQGLIVMDEPCKGTNPAEATAIVNALSKNYAASESSFLVATHYPVAPQPGIRYYQVIGIRPDALEQLPGYLHEKQGGGESESENEPPSGLASLATPDMREDLTRVRRIQNLMDYRLEEIDGTHAVPSGAIKIAELLGVDEELIREMKAAWQEE